MSEPVKSCAFCNALWDNIKQLVEDKSLDLNGYQASFRGPENGLIMLTHNVDGCNSTMAIRAGELKSLYQGQFFSEHRTEKPECPRKCLNPNDYEPCPVHCDMAWVREILQCFRTHEMPA